MLTRNGERVVEVMLVAGCLAAATVFQDSSMDSGSPEVMKHDGFSMIIRVNRQTGRKTDGLGPSRTAPLLPTQISILGQIIGKTKTHVPDQKPRIRRC